MSNATSVRRTAAAALGTLTVLALSACGGLAPAEHGTVKEKRAHHAYTSNETHQRYKQNCRDTTVKDGKSTKTKRTCSKAPDGYSTTTVAHPARYELELSRGGRTEWTTVSQDTYDRVQVGDTI
ncbi:hypothetical protein OG689_44395 [Kitasatospora sp. NBC_00240]|uniref:hypothetical protein n=1 Tax=Kitasatospora sp. NBC_00240 TaxID=2903567 RepID=UPI002252439A|nr:hypothetical protein [Kitasatospora sp. NBC_00240]MCX5216179.1 hypothetical protein [Kitasatospora sp. NBC_00240]